MSNAQKWIRTYSLNNRMLVRTVIIYVAMTVCALAFHENTFAVWELLLQLEYVTADQRIIVYEEIQHIRSEIQRVIDLLVQHDQSQHP